MLKLLRAGLAAAALQLAAVVIITLLDLLLGLRGIANETELTTRKTTAAGCRITICDMGISSSCGRRPREDIILEKPRYGAFHGTDLISFSEIEASIRSSSPAFARTSAARRLRAKPR